VCSGYSEWSTSQFVLPYPAGSSYTVIQGNCSPPGNGHRGSNRYAYDFGMPIGSTIAAMRGGVVREVEESHTDGQIATSGFDNYLLISHDDGTTALYGHLTHNGASVAIGQVVAQGQPIGLSGNTGNTAGLPHLHVSIQGCDPVALGTGGCPSLPLTFSNTDANPSGLVNGRSYGAR
jgi:murein DD-endopeptidase MepM/ murein hydrolase activator NlpD